MNDALNAPLNSAVTANSESPSNVASGSSIPHEPIAIVGIGCAFPKAPSVDEFWQNIKHGVDGITDVPDTHWRLSDYFDADPNAPDMTYGCRGGFLEPAPFDTLEFGIAPRNLEATDTSQLFAMLAARDALRDAGYAPDAKKGEGKPFNRERTSVILGVTGALELVIPLGARLGHPQWRAGLQDAGVSAELADEVVSRISEQFVDWQENSFPGLLGNVAAGRVANRFDLGGTNCVVDAACASSLGALHLAILELQSGRADVALSGGIDTFNDIFMYMCFSKTPALSPTGESRPFDHDGDGTILGEGAGVLMLKRLSDAQRDGDHIRAVIKGIGSSSDGRGNAIYAPSAHGQQRALRAAFADAGVTPDTIELFEAHGTGTRVGDATEVDSLTSVFGEAERVGTWCALGSVKSMIGHTKAAAGVAGLIKAALALEHKVLPPTLKVNQPLANLAAGQVPVYINANARPWVGHGHHPRRASLSAFGFGGSNFHCVLEEFEGAESRVDWGGDTLIFAVSAPAAPALSQRLADYIGPLLETPAQASTQTSIAAREHWRHARAVAANTRQQFDPNDGARAIIVLQRTQVLVQSLADELRQRAALVTSIAAQLTPAGFASRDDVFVGLGPVPGRVAVLFPGQGSQRPDMLKDLACQFPEFLDVMQAANAALGPVTDQGPSVSELSELVYPHAAFDPETKKRQAEQLRNTQFAQPALGASELAAWDVLQRFGLEA
ncbi:MAG: acyl transferase domain-containing protein, partial [Gammaproteobacteria bacterium]